MTNEFELKRDGTLAYDPPSGWQYGFPKRYKPLPGETIIETLIRDGYPAKLANELGKYTRFIEGYFR